MTIPFFLRPERPDLRKHIEACESLSQIGDLRLCWKNRI